MAVRRLGQHSPAMTNQLPLPNRAGAERNGNPSVRTRLRGLFARPAVPTPEGLALATPSAPPPWDAYPQPDVPPPPLPPLPRHLQQAGRQPHVPGQPGTPTDAAVRQLPPQH